MIDNPIAWFIVGVVVLPFLAVFAVLLLIKLLARVISQIGRMVVDKKYRDEKLSGSIE